MCRAGISTVKHRQSLGPARPAPSKGLLSLWRYIRKRSEKMRSGKRELEDPRPDARAFLLRMRVRSCRSWAVPSSDPVCHRRKNLDRTVLRRGLEKTASLPGFKTINAGEDVGDARNRGCRQLSGSRRRARWSANHHHSSHPWSSSGELTWPSHGFRAGFSSGNLRLEALQIRRPKGHSKSAHGNAMGRPTSIKAPLWGTHKCPLDCDCDIGMGRPHRAY